MANQGNHRGFSLEKRFPGTFLLQGVLAGLIVSYLNLFYLATLGANLFMVFYILPWILTVCAGVCTMLALFLWLPAEAFDIQADAASRVGLAVSYGLLLLLLGTIISAFWGSTSIEQFGLGLCIVSVVGIITGLVVGSRVRPWGFLTFGTVEVVDDAATYEITTTSKLALLGSLPLRLVSLLTLLVSLWQTGSFWSTWYEHPRAFVLILIAFYSAASAYLSFKSPRRGILITLGSLLNLPFLFLILNNYFNPEAAMFEPLLESKLAGAFIGLWILCITARARVHMPHPMFRDYRQLCLGQRFSESETPLQVVDKAQIWTN